MQNLKHLGQKITKDQQAKINGGSAATNGDLSCRVTPQSSWIVVNTYPNNEACRADIFVSYCYDGGPYENCQCSGDAAYASCYM